MTKSTQWTHPRTNKMKRVNGDLPLGWERQIEEGTGKILFIDHQNESTTYTDPRLAFAVEEVPQNIGEVRQRFDASSTSLQVLHGKDLSGKVALITGCNTGIGMETAKSLAFHGCTIIMANRNEKRTVETITLISRERPGTRKLFKFRKLNLASFASVQQFVNSIKLEFRHLDYVILNAAVFGIPYTQTEDGLEAHFQICHLSHFYLTLELESLYNHTTRIVVLSSESHRYANWPEKDLREEHLNVPASKYWSMIAYNNVKLCNALFARELGKRWQDKGISVFACHPGNMVSSHLSRNWWFYRLIFAVVRPFTKSLQQASSTTIYCATSVELTGLTGIYFNNCYFCEPSKAAQSEYLSDTLWKLSEEIIERTLKNIKK